jgi:hypothetical protein
MSLKVAYESISLKRSIGTMPQEVCQLHKQQNIWCLFMDTKEKNSLMG